MEENNNIDVNNIETNNNLNGMNRGLKKRHIANIIIIIITIVIGASVYSKYNYNDYTKSVTELKKSVFTRDSNEKYSKMKSYKIENKEFNDAIFYKTIEVEPNTPYKVTCMVKTENVENMEDKYIGGAQIAIVDTTECSRSITGTSDWTELTFMFNSKNRTSVDLGFRLGGYNEKSKGIAWFSDFKLEEGGIDLDKTWNMACFIIEEIDLNVKVDNRDTNVNVKMPYSDIDSVENNMKRLVNTFRNLSANQMTIEYDIINIKTPLTTISYDEEHEYYIDPGDAKKLIEEYVQKEEYDYIFVATKLGDLNENKTILVHDWIGLGGMDYYGIGFSNIRLPEESNSYIYVYDSRINIFPEEVYVHEFLHTMERNEEEYGNENIADLHDHGKYGYNQEHLIGLKNWYEAYMKNTIKNSDGTSAGLTKNSYSSKPIHESNFKYSYELNDLREPDNLMEEISILVNRIKKLFHKRRLI